VVPLAVGGYTRSVERDQKQIILEESEIRAANRDAAPDSFVEHRTSDEATPPLED
jgi:hypothetical protein